MNYGFLCSSQLGNSITFKRARRNSIRSPYDCPETSGDSGTDNIQQPKQQNILAALFSLNYNLLLKTISKDLAQEISLRLSWVARIKNKNEKLFQDWIYFISHYNYYETTCLLCSVCKASVLTVMKRFPFLWLGTFTVTGFSSRSVYKGLQSK